MVEDLFGDDDEGAEEKVATEEEDRTDEVEAEDKMEVEASKSQKSAVMRDVFGDESEEEEEEEEEEDAEPSSIERRGAETKALFSEEFDAPAAKVKTSAHLCLPLLPASRGSQHIVIRTPAFLGIQTAAFEAGAHDGKAANAEAVTFEGASSIIRWSYVRDAAGACKLGADGRRLVESNARLVRYADGSTQLVVGEAVYDADTHPTPHSFVYDRLKNAPDPLNPSAPLAEVLECSAAVSSKLSLRPSSLTSEVHKRVVAYMRDKNTRKAVGKKVRLGKTYIPEQKKELREKEDDDRIKREKRGRAQMDGKRYGSYRRPAMSKEFLEEGMDEAGYDSVNVSKMKYARRRQSYYDEEEDDEMDGFIVKDDEDDDEEDRWLGSSRGRGSHKQREREDEEEEEEDDFDDEEEVISSRRPARRAPLDDEDEDDGGRQPKAKKQSRSIVDEDD